MSRAPPALASLKLGVGELGGFTGSGTKRLGPPALFPEPGVTPPELAGAAALGSFLKSGQEEGTQRRVPKDEMGRKAWVIKGRNQNREKTQQLGPKMGRQRGVDERESPSGQKGRTKRQDEGSQDAVWPKPTEQQVNLLE